MNSFKKSNCKLLVSALFLAASMFSFNLNSKVKAAEIPADEITVNPVTSTVSTNMLNVDTAIITKATMTNLVGKDQQITAKFDDLPQTNEKIFAVLVDAVAGGVISCDYLDANNKVVFSKIPEYVKIPGIHLYKQGADDPQFLLRKENFVASTSYLMPYGKKIINNGGLQGNEVQAYRGNGTVYSGVPKAKLFTTTVPDVYSLAIPANTMSFIDGGSGVTANKLLAAVIAEDDNGNPVEVRQWVATDYNELSSDPAYLCRFEFLLPKNTKKFQVHLYKDALLTENFLCKYLMEIDKQPATNYSLSEE